MGLLTPPNFNPPVARSALVALKRAVASYLEAAGSDAEVFLGLKYRSNWETSRVVLIDGVFSGESPPRSLSAGRLAAPTQKTSINPRELFSWPRPITVSVRGVDKTALDDEEAQTEAQETLVELTLQALWNAVDPKSGRPVGQANFQDYGDMLWVQPPVQQPFGKELLIGMVLKTVIFDAAQATQMVTPKLGKGPLLTTSSSGLNARVLSADAKAKAAVIGNLGFISPAWVGLNLLLEGAADAGNLGSFPIAGFADNRSLIITNATAVAPDPNNGSIRWQVVAST